MVDVRHKRGQRMAVASGFGQFHVHPFLELTPVGEPGQGIGVHQTGDGFIGRFQLPVFFAELPGQIGQFIREPGQRGDHFMIGQTDGMRKKEIVLVDV